MRATTIITTLLFGITIAAPGAVSFTSTHHNSVRDCTDYHFPKISLKRSFVEADTSVDAGDAAVANTPTACVECPCNVGYLLC